MDAGMQRVIERFPKHPASIRELFHADQSFLEMCGDYVDTLEALQRWQASSGPHKAARIAEYRELAEALEIEIAAALRLPTEDRIT
jgi:hypothetical protein